MDIQPYPEIHEYTAVFMDGSKVKRKYHSLEPLQTPLYLYGSHVLRKLILRFAPPSYHRYYYPYGAHNVVIEQLPPPPLFDTSANALNVYPQFRIQFYHYYNVKNERVDIPLEQQYYDFCAVEQFLYQHPVLYHAFHGRILRPAFASFAPSLFPPRPFSPPLRSFSSSLPDSTSPPPSPPSPPDSPPRARSRSPSPAFCPSLSCCFPATSLPLEITKSIPP